MCLLLHVLLAYVYVNSGGDWCRKRVSDTLELGLLHEQQVLNHSVIRSSHLHTYFSDPTAQLLLSQVWFLF